MITPEWAADAYYRMVKIRKVEEAIAAEYKNQEMRCPVHLSIGQEAAAVGVSMNLNSNDVAFSTHRCHSHYLAKGGDLDAMVAELYGKRTGCSAGMGGSMHLVDVKMGMMGASAIVGGSIPLAVGAALMFSMSGKDHVAVAYFGDGAAEQGVFYESLNFAALKRLPVIFACENNFLATASPLVSRRAKDNIFAQGEAFGIPGAAVDGNDVFAVYEAARMAIQRARSGQGPSLIESRTFRVMKHVGVEEDCSSGVRTKRDLSEWKNKCPIKRFETRCDLEELIASENRASIRHKVEEEIDHAFKFAKASLPAVWI